MWTPTAFREDDPALLADVIERYPFGMLVSAGARAPEATHLPFMLRRDPMRLVGHLARANPHWRAWGAGREVLVIFAGPHSYVSPTWYAEDEVVPTWNYVAVHVYGVPVLIDDPSELLALALDQVRHFEAAEGGARAREMGDGEAGMGSRDELLSELRGIVGFEIPIERIEGKFKLNQNRSRQDRERVAAVLAGSDDPRRRELGALMTRSLDDDDGPRAGSRPPRP